MTVSDKNLYAVMILCSKNFAAVSITFAKEIRWRKADSYHGRRDKVLYYEDNEH
jgi:hypothetical protein